MRRIFWLASYPRSGGFILRSFLPHLLEKAVEEFPFPKIFQRVPWDGNVSFVPKEGELAEREKESSEKKEDPAKKGKSKEQKKEQKKEQEKKQEKPAPEEKQEKEQKKPTPDGIEAWIQRRLAMQKNIATSPHLFSGQGLVLLRTAAPVVRMKEEASLSRESFAGALYIVRNPLDIATSFSSYFGCSVDEAIDSLCLQGFQEGTDVRGVHNRYAFSWTNHVAGWASLSSKGVCMIKYETFLESPKKVFKDISKFLKVVTPADVLSRLVKYNSFDSLCAQEKRDGFAEKPIADRPYFRYGKAGRWKKELTPAQVQRIVDAHGPTMEKFGYLP